MSEERKSLVIDIKNLEADPALSKLIDHALALRSSDLFFTPTDDGVLVLVRSLGIIRQIAAMPPEQGRRVMQHLKAMAGMDISERRRPTDGRWIYEAGDGDDERAADLRISAIPTMYGEDLAIRLLDRSTQLYVLESLGLTGRQFDQVQAMIENPSGLILCTGPTGSGKTATMYASLIRLNDGQRKINTIEDPIEFAVDGLRQSQVHTQIELGYAELLRGVLRQSPDVIMIGEIRDEATALTAVHAANSGTLVLATIHAPTAPGAVQSMRALGVHPHFLATALRGVIAQRLVRTLCKECRMSFDLTDAPHTFDDVRKWLGEDEGNKLYAAKGCEKCGMTGYSARTGVFEVMSVTRTLRNLISDAAPTREIRAQANAEGMLEFRQAALLKVAHGVTSTEEVFRVVPSEHLMLED